MIVDDLLKGCVCFLQSLHGLLEAAFHLRDLLPVVPDVALASVTHPLCIPEYGDADNDDDAEHDDDEDGDVTLASVAHSLSIPEYGDVDDDGMAIKTLPTSGKPC